MNAHEDFTFTDAHRAALHCIAQGADIHSDQIAFRLREIEQHHPELLSISEPQMAANKNPQQQPWFGAILTDAGREMLGLTEKITWITAGGAWNPDNDRVVLLRGNHPDFPVWMGHWDAKADLWIDTEDCSLDPEDVFFWAEMPKGPKQ